MSVALGSLTRVNKIGLFRAVYQVVCLGIGVSGIILKWSALVLVSVVLY